MQKILTNRFLRLFFMTLLTVIWISTPAVAQRYFSYEHRSAYSGFSLFGATNLWDVLRKDFQLSNEEERPYVRAEINHFSKNQKYLDNAVARAAPYLYYIREQINKRHLPGELALLPIIESSYNPFARSDKGAVGLWQFMPGTARLYGLKQDSWYDGRRDVIESTRAALDHLTHLYELFNGDWLLAIAAYNSGEGLVKAAIEHNRRLGKSTDFWSLHLPEQTKRYVPRLIALASVVKMPDQYEVQLSPIRNAPYFAQVELDSAVNLAKAAHSAGMELAQLHALNAGFKRTASDPTLPARLLVPIKAMNRFNHAQPDENKELFSQAEVGKRFAHVDENHESEIKEGATSLLPSAGKSDSSHALNGPKVVAVKRIQHTVKNGETLYNLASHYHVSVAELCQWNHLSTKSTLGLGTHLILWQKA